MSLVRSNHVFKGHKALLGNRFVTYGEVELPVRYEEFAKSGTGFDWGVSNSGAQQLAYSILRQFSDSKFSREYVVQFANDIVASLNSRDWILSTLEVHEWMKKNTPVGEQKQQKEIKKFSEPRKLKPKKNKNKNNVVKAVCKELSITQKELAHILEVPEGTISSWAVKNEIPRLGKKAIEFYICSAKNQQVVDSYKNFVNLLNAS